MENWIIDLPTNIYFYRINFRFRILDPSISLRFYINYSLLFIQGAIALGNIPHKPIFIISLNIRNIEYCWIKSVVPFILFRQFYFLQCLIPSYDQLLYLFIFFSIIAVTSNTHIQLRFEIGIIENWNRF